MHGDFLHLDFPSGFAAISKSDWDILLGAPVLTKGFFGLISLVAQHLNRVEGESSELSHHFPVINP